MNVTRPSIDPSRAGFFFALSAYFLWGLLPLYWKLTENIDAVEVTAHRALWSVPVAALVCWVLGRTGDILPTLRSPRKLAILFTCSCLISFNWAVFIWAIAVDRVLETALAYYINPLFSVLLGFVFLGDRFNRLQSAAIAIAAAAVLMLTILGGAFPWISLSLALTFGLYGLLRKTVDVGPTQGFLVEVLLIFPIAVGYVLWVLFQGQSALQASSFSGAVPPSLLLILAGPATAVPLILYAFGAKRLRLSTIGLMQFIAPTMFFLLSIFVFKEPLREVQLYAFMMIWFALALYAFSLFKRDRADVVAEATSHR